MRTCTVCKETKALIDFGFRSAGNGSFTNQCKSCLSKASARSHAKKKARDPEAYLARKRNTLQKNRSTIKGKHSASMSSVLHNYYIAEADLQDLLNKQKGCCAICGADFGTLETNKNRAYMIDHDHKTSQVRGLLCHWCNTTLGHIESNKIDPMRFIEYLGD